MKALRKKDEPIFNRIWASIFTEEEVQLTEAEQAIRDRWDYSWKILCGVTNTRNAIIALRKKFAISERQAYHDLKAAIDLFSDPRLATKQQKHAIAEEWIVKGLKLALKNKDLDNYSRLMRRYNAMNGLEDFTAPQAPREAFEITFSSDPKVLRAQMDQLMKDAEDIDHEEVPE